MRFYTKRDSVYSTEPSFVARVITADPGVTQEVLSALASAPLLAAVVAALLNRVDSGSALNPEVIAQARHALDVYTGIAPVPPHVPEEDGVVFLVSTEGAVSAFPDLPTAKTVVETKFGALGRWEQDTIYLVDAVEVATVTRVQRYTSLGADPVEIIHPHLAGAQS